MAHVLKIGMLASEAAQENKKRKDGHVFTTPEEFDFERPTFHEIFQLGGPDAKTVVADPLATEDLKFYIGQLSNAVKEKYNITYISYGMSGTVVRVPEGNEKFNARLDDIDGFIAQIDNKRVPVVIWSAFRKLVLGFHAIEFTEYNPAKLLEILDKAAKSSGFLPDAADGIYYYDPSQAQMYESDGDAEFVPRYRSMIG